MLASHSLDDFGHDEDLNGQYIIDDGGYDENFNGDVNNGGYDDNAFDCGTTKGDGSDFNDSDFNCMNNDKFNQHNIMTMKLIQTMKLNQTTKLIQKMMLSQEMILM